MTKALQRIMTLENELKILDSYIKNLQIYHEDEVKSLKIELEKSEHEITELEKELRKRHSKIADLEYELFLEKTRDSKHRFYWFTAKIPVIADVSYTNNENDFYGFKQPPKYSVIEQHDLRFITNCSLDDLVEQYR